MTTIDPAVLVGAVAGLVTLQLTSLGILVAVLRFFTVGIPGTLPAAPPAVPDAPDEPPAGPPPGGRT